MHHTEQKGDYMTTQLQKTNEEMLDEAISYFKPKAKASDFEKPLPDLFYKNEQTRRKLKDLFELENRTIVDLRNLQDYIFIKTMNDTSGKDKLLDCFQDVLTHIIDEVIEQKDPVAYKLIMEKYT